MVYWTNIYMEPNIAYVKFENQKHMHPKKNGNLALSFRILKRKKNKQDLPFFFGRHHAKKQCIFSCHCEARRSNLCYFLNG